MGRRSREKSERRRDAPAPSAAPASGQRAAARVRGPRPEGPPLPIAPDPSVEVTPWAEVWRADGAAFTTIFVVALLFRIAVLVQTAGTPFIEVANIDSESYQKWARELVTNGWWPVRNFYQSPFYAYFLAIIFRVFGDGPWAPRLVQVILGSLTPIVVPPPSGLATSTGKP